MLFDKNLVLICFARQDAALASLKLLTRNDVVEVRAMMRPPDGVRMVVEAVCIMKGVKPKKVAGDKVRSSVCFRSHLINLASQQK